MHVLYKIAVKEKLQKGKNKRNKKEAEEWRKITVKKFGEVHTVLVIKQVSEWFCMRQTP